MAPVGSEDHSIWGLVGGVTSVEDCIRIRDGTISENYTTKVHEEQGKILLHGLVVNLFYPVAIEYRFGTYRGKYSAKES